MARPEACITDVQISGTWLTENHRMNSPQAPQELPLRDLKLQGPKCSLCHVGASRPQPELVRVAQATPEACSPALTQVRHTEAEDQACQSRASGRG